MSYKLIYKCAREMVPIALSVQRFYHFGVLFLISLTLSVSAKAETPRVVSDIKPIHSLVNMVLGDLGTSELIISRNVSPHDYSMRPSEVRMVVESDIIFWTGPAILPSFEKVFEELPPGTQAISLLAEVEDLLLPIRDLGAFFEDEDHEGEDDHDEESKSEKNGHDEDEDHGDEAENGEEHHEGEDDHDEEIRK